MKVSRSTVQKGDFEQKMLQGVSRSFALTIPQLPSDLRTAVTNGYLLCRIADTIEDETGLTIDQKRSFFQQFIDVVMGHSRADRFAEGLYPLLSDRTLLTEKELIKNTALVIERTFSLKDAQQAALKRCAEIMATGMLRFQEIKSPNGLKSLQEMDSYCYYVAGVVGEMLTDLFCEYSKEISKNREMLFKLASSFGQGLQMTNILKDLWDDRQYGACWLPQDVFEEVGFDLKNLSIVKYVQSFGEGLGQLIGMAQEHLRNALTYSLIIPPHEAGIRKFCLWAIGMAVFTLRNINRRKHFRSGREVKISRRRVKAIILSTNATLRNDYLLTKLFDFTTKGLSANNLGFSAK